MRRRSVLLGTGIALASMAGCLGSQEFDEPDPNTAIEDVVPEPDGWTVVGRTEQDAGAIGAEDGLEVRYDDPDGERYTLELMRFASSDDADDATPDAYGEWNAWLTHGAFSFAVNGDSASSRERLLVASPILDSAIVSARIVRT